jgi:hypothetical protein
VDRIFPMESLAQAHVHLEEQRNLGKVVVSGFGVPPGSIEVRAEQAPPLAG